MMKNENNYEQQILLKCEGLKRIIFYGTNDKKTIDIKKKLNVVIKKILTKIMPYEIEIEGIENIPSGANIYANSHQDFNDIVNSIYACPSHFYTLNSSNVNVILKGLLNINGVVFVDRFSKDSKLKANKEMIEHLNKNESINIYPEATWNNSPNKLHLPLYKGMVEIAKVTGRPLIPVAQEYKYEYDKNGNLQVKKVYMKYGCPMYIKENDDVMEKLSEFDEQLSTLQWELMEKSGSIIKRENIDDQYYYDLLRKKINSVKSTGSNMNDEARAILNYDDEFYQYFPANEHEHLRK